MKKSTYRTPTAEHDAFLDELRATLGSSGKNLQAEDLLVVTAQFLGILVALQDSRRFTPQMVMEMVMRNIEIGNAATVDTYLGQTEGEA